MGNISIRSQQLGTPPTRKLVPLSEKVEKEGVHVYHLNLGQPDIPTPKAYFEALKTFDGRNGDMVDAYVKSQGLPELRKDFIEYTKLTVEGVDDLGEENCFITIGGSEALEKLIFVLFNEEDKVIVPEPYYSNYNNFFEMNSVNIVPYPTNIEDNFSMGNVVTRIENMVKKDNRIKGILITNPDNPTGCVYTKKELEGIAEIVKRHNLWLISDEVYREMVYDDETPRSFLSFESIRQNTVVIDSVSKKWSACGARIGAVITHNESVLANMLKTLQSRLSASRVNQYASAKMIEKDIEILRKRKEGQDAGKTIPELAAEEYKKRRGVALKVLKKYGVKCGYPKGALYVVADLGEKNGEPINAEGFVAFMLEEFRVDNKTTMVTFAEPFYKTPGRGISQVRIAFVLNEKEIEDSIEILCRGLEAYKRK